MSDDEEVPIHEATTHEVIIDGHIEQEETDEPDEYQLYIDEKEELDLEYDVLQAIRAVATGRIE
jgi:hypothetical protein